MKSNRIEIYSILSVILIYVIMFKMIVVEKYVDISHGIHLFFILSMLFISIVIFGFKKSKETLLRGRVNQIIFIFLIIYFIAIYFFGLLTGFLANVYATDIVSIIKNTYLIILIMVSEELLRYNLLNNSRRNNVGIILITFSFVLLDIIMEINSYNLNSASGIFKFVALCVLPYIARNALMSFLSLRVDYVPCMIYLFIMELYVFILPIFPNLGEYLECIIGILLPFIIFIRTNNVYYISTSVPRKTKDLIRWYVYVPILAVVVSMVLLVSGMFRYQMIAVGSNSMYPAIKRGDAIIIKKMPKKDHESLKEGDILVFKNDKHTILHRITKIARDDNDQLVFKTKGDNNNSEDDFIIKSKDIIGIVILKLPYVGYPTVYINDLFSAK